MRTIVNHPLIYVTPIMMHVGSRIVKIAYKHPEPYMLVEADTNQPKEPRKFEIYKHDQEIPEHANYAGTYRNQDKVWCVYDVTEVSKDDWLDTTKACDLNDPECEACQ